MRESEKRDLALAACRRHERDYGVKIPERLLRFWQTGEAFGFNGKCLPEGTDIPGFEEGSFRLFATVPSWRVLGSLGGLDDAISGPGGEWQHAGNHMPLFEIEQGRFIVVRLDDPALAVGFYEDETHTEDGEGYHQGVFKMAPSLDGFLDKLVDLEEALFEHDLDEAIWEDAADEAWHEDDQEDLAL